MPSPTKKGVLEHANISAITDIIVEAWSKLLDEEEQELCLENLYESLANSTPQPENFSLLSNDDKAQYEIDIDMVLITVDFKDLAKLIFNDGENEHYFWSLVGDRSDKKNKKIFTTLFR